MTDGALLEFDRLTASSPMGDVGDIEPLSFSVAPGEIGVLLGGKLASGVLRLAMGEGRIRGGCIRRFGTPMEEEPSFRANVPFRRKIGFAFREKGLLSNLTVRDNVELPLRYHGYDRERGPRESGAETALREAGVGEEFWNLRPSRINWQIRKKTLLARATVLDPPLIVLDDPSALLATPVVPEVLGWIRRQKRRGRGILMGTNDYPFGLSLADWVVDPAGGRAHGDFEAAVERVWLDCARSLRARVDACEA